MVHHVREHRHGRLDRRIRRIRLGIHRVHRLGHHGHHHGHHHVHLGKYRDLHDHRIPLCFHLHLLVLLV